MSAKQLKGIFFSKYEEKKNDFQLSTFLKDLVKKKKILKDYFNR